MKKMNNVMRLLLLLGFLLGGLVLNIVPVSAQENIYPWHISVFGGMGFPENNNIDEPIIGGLRLTRDMTRVLELGLEVSWQQYDDEISSINLGDVDQVPIFILLKFNLPVDGAVLQPYALAGAGLSYWNYDANFSTISDADDISFVTKLAGGIELGLGERLDLFAEGGYMWSDNDVSGTVTSGSTTVNVSDNAEVNEAFAHAGIKINF